MVSFRLYNHVPFRNVPNISKENALTTYIRVYSILLHNLICLIITITIMEEIYTEKGLLSRCSLGFIYKFYIDNVKQYINNICKQLQTGNQISKNKTNFDLLGLLICLVYILTLWLISSY